ncbi:helix-turn-helix domain-containing protein [Serinibacter arcticus]|nr:helix-turn-helix domain-containing protein [Serinibacter arcticus]
MVTSPKTGDLGVGRRIASRREQLGLSRRALAEATGLSYPYIAQIETGYRMPSSRHQGPIARVLGLSLDELFGEEAPDGITSAGTGTERGLRRPSVPQAVDAAVAALESLPASVRLEALSQLQLRVVTGVAEEQARRRSI